MRQRIPLPVAPRPARHELSAEEVLRATPEQTAKLVSDATAWLRSLVAYCCAKEHEDPGAGGLTNQTCPARGTNMLCSHQSDQDIDGKVLMGNQFEYVMKLAYRVGALSAGEAAELSLQYADAEERLKKLDDVAAGGYHHFNHSDLDGHTGIASMMAKFRSEILPLLGSNPTRDAFREYILRQEEVLAEPMEHIRDRLLKALEHYDPERAFADRKPQNRLPVPAKPEAKGWYASLVERAKKIWPN